MSVLMPRRRGQVRRLTGILLAFLLALVQYSSVGADATAQTLPFSQDWTNTSLIGLATDSAGTLNAAENWTAVPGIVGYRGDALTSATGTNPQTILADGTGTPVQVLSNLTSATLATGGIGEFDGIANPTVAFQGSGTARAPFLLVSITTTGKSNIGVAYNLRDIDGTADNAVQPVALQYRVGQSGSFTNVPSGFVADASTGPNLATLVTPVAVTLPSAADNQPLVQLRIITSDAVGSDEWIGIDDIAISGGSFVPSPTNPSGVGLASPAGVPAGGSTVLTVQVTLGTNPASTGAGVFVDATTIGGASQQVLFDDGLNGDATAGDGIFSWRAPVPPAAPTGPRSLPYTVTDAQTRSSSGSILLSITGPPQPPAPISTIQGPGATSPFVDQLITVEGIVTARRSNGFFMQTPDGEDDGDPATSEGLFVFTSSAPDVSVAVGSRVNVKGKVQEFIPSQDVNSPPATELITPSIVVLSLGNPLPAPVVITAADTNPLDPVATLVRLEQLEGMRVQVNSLDVVAPTSGTINEANALSVSDGVFYGVISGVARPFREPGVQVPDPLPAGAPPNVPRFDANPERLRVDSDGQPGASKIDVAAGQVVTNLVGPLDYSFRTYTILPDLLTPPAVSGTVLPTPVAGALPDEFTIGSQNFERFFDTINDPGVSDVALTPDAFKNRLNKASLTIRLILRSPDILGVVEIENLNALQQLADKVNSDVVALGDPNPLYVPYLVEGNDIGGIDVGFLVKSTRVNVIDVTQAGKDDTFVNPNDGMSSILNDRPPLILRATILNPAGPDFPVTVIANHLRSLSGVDDPLDGNRIRFKRRAQAEFLANLVQARQLADPGEHIVLVGDFNAFGFNDGYVDSMGIIRGSPSPADEALLSSADLVNPDLIDLIDELPADQRYSYSFDGNAQVLDHILTTQNLLPRIDGLAMARSNGDFPESLRNDANSPVRLTDHDGLVAYFNLPAPPSTTTVVSSSTNPAAVGDTVVFTATVSSGTTTIGAGSVTFNEGSVILAGPLAVNSGGQASFSTAALGSGSHVITAEYAGTKQWQPSSGMMTQSIDALNAPTPTIAIANVAGSENHADLGGFVDFVFSVALSSPSDQPVSVHFSTKDGTAVDGVGRGERFADYVAQFGTLIFAPGVTTRTITVRVVNDLLAEPTETFGVRLSAPVNAVLGDAAAVGRIRDSNEPAIASFAPGIAPALSVITITGVNLRAATAVRFNGTPTLFFVVDANTIRAIVPRTVTSGPISVTTRHGTATSAARFTAAPRIVAFVPPARRAP
jgi:uncharacterized protein